MVGGKDGWFLEQVIGKAANAGVLDQAEDEHEPGV